MWSLARHAAPFVAIALLQASLAGVSLTILSSVRAYVAGEGQWSKGQRSAVHFIQKYVRTGDERDFEVFQSAISVPFADRRARQALEGNALNLEVARTGFLGGGNHPEDVPGLIWLFRVFQDSPLMADAVREWRATDQYIDQLLHIGLELKLAINAGGIDETTARNFRREIDEIGSRLAWHAERFSDSLGTTSRLVALILTAANLMVAAAFVFLIVLHLRNMLRRQMAFAKALNDERERAQVTLASIGEAVISTDMEGHVTYMNPEAERLIGISAEDAKRVSLESLFDIIDEETGAIDDQLAKRLVAAPSRKRRQLLVPNGAWSVPISVQSAPLHLSGTATGGVLVLHDMTSEQELIDRLARQASYDDLTGLANRRNFEARIQQTLDRSSASASHCLMMLDLDQFKVVNDTCGHSAGDELLRQTSKVLAEALGSDGVLARLGGDEFGILIEDCDVSWSVSVAERLLTAIREMRFISNGRTFTVGVSIGVASTSKSVPIGDAMSAADVACFMAKERGRNRVQVYHPSDDELTQRVSEMTWVQRIGTALEEQRFCLYAQEIRQLNGSASGRHVEILLRLRDESGNLVPPASFIPAAERFGLMSQLDRWVVRTAIEHCARRLNDMGSEREISYAINLSGKSIGDDDFTDYVRDQLQKHGIPPRLICFEITETSAIANLHGARRFIESFRELGCKFALDDFGTGMSSISYLKSLPVDYIKIDGCFVKEILKSDVDRAMVEMIARLGKMLGKAVVAEFAETDAIVDELRAMGIDYAQGYAIGKPMPLDEFARDTGVRLEVA